MAKVYLTVLGTNEYLECTYCFSSGFQVPGVWFVQEATSQYLCGEWGEEDRLMVFLTDQARKLNWEDDGHTSRDGTKLKREGLRKRLERLQLKAPLHDISIPEGKNEDEIWEIFRILFEKLQPEDEVFLDITHAFRSLPMLVLVVLNYAKALKGIRVRGIYYGAFEVLGPPSVVREIEPCNRLAPVFDLTPFAQLLDWTVAIDLFVRSGNGSLVADLAEQRAREEKKIVRGPHAGADAARILASKLKQFTGDLATCRGRNISTNALELKQAIARCKDNPLIPQLGPLLDRLATQVEQFDGNEIRDGARAAKWCLDHGLIQQAYTILRELIVTEATKQMGVPSVEPESYRRGVDHAIGTDVGVLRDFRNNPGRFGNDPEPRLLHFNDKADLVRLFDEIGDPRNDLNHAGMRPNPRTSSSFSDQLPGLIQRFAKVIA